MTEIFNIIDGSTTINLLDQTNYSLVSWTPSLPAWKDNGTRSSSKLADNSRVVDRKFENTTDTMVLAIIGSSQDAVITNLNTLFAALENAVAYWTESIVNTPVYISAKANNETGTRYAVIRAYKIEELPPVFSGGFRDGAIVNGEYKVSVMTEITIAIEHGHWMELPPDQSDPVQLTGQSMTVGGRALGYASTTDPVYVAGVTSTLNVTHMYTYDDSAATFSANLMDAALPFSLLPSPLGANDCLYIGGSNTVFSNVIFDIGTEFAGTATRVWEYYNGSAWVSIPNIRDDTSGLGVTGIGIVCFRRPLAWAGTTINGVALYWIRLRVSAYTSMSAVPTQQNRDIYSCVWPYVEIAASEIAGNIPALVKMKIHGQMTTAMPTTKIIAGLRSYDRGPDFWAYVSPLVSNNPAPFDGGSIGNASEGSYIVAPNGSTCLITTEGPIVDYSEFLTLGTLAQYAEDYRGKFHLYARVLQVGGAANQFTLKFIIQSNGYSQSFIAPVTTANAPLLLDLGMVTFPMGASSKIATVSQQNGIIINGYYTYTEAPPATGFLYLYDLIFMPADEWIGEFTGTLIEGNEALYDMYLEVSGINPYRAYAIKKLESDDSYVTAWSSVGAKPTIKPNTRQRLWFIIESGSTGYVENVVSVELSKNQQYLAMRGNQ